MATERNVVDFKIHNLTEEQFQELKAQGKIDPNAVYCTPDESLKKNQITNCITEIPQDIKLTLTPQVVNLYAWNWSMTDNIVYTKTETPVVGDTLYNASGSVLTDSIIAVGDGTIYVNESGADGRAYRSTSDDVTVRSGNVLTLKAGSKVYLATGNSSFPANTVESDIEKTNIYNGRYLVIRNSQTSLYCANTDSCTSGTIADRPTSTQNATGLYFATDENKMYLTGNSGADWYSTAYMTLPIAIITVKNGAISSIDQVFNGFGYIGSTVFALPGVKGLIPNGRNEDGTLKNIEFTISKVVTATDSSTSTNVLTINNPNIKRISVTNYFYDEQKNIIINKHNNVQQLVALYGFNKTNNGVVSEFVTKTSFRAVDYNDSNYIANCAMPSNRYIDLSSMTITDGMNLTAPADGYYSLYKVSTAAGQMVGFLNSVSGLSVRCYSNDTGETLGVSIPVSKGQTITLRNSTGGNVSYFRFVYANGSK